MCCPSYLDIIFLTSKLHFLNFPRSEQLHNSMWHSAPKTNMRPILGLLSSSIALHDTCHCRYVISEPVLIFLCNSQVLPLHFSPQILILRVSHIFLLFPLHWGTIPSSSLHWTFGMFCCKHHQPNGSPFIIFFSSLHPVDPLASSFQSIANFHGFTEQT